jgi:fructose-specific phosphotransferase system IIC component
MVGTGELNNIFRVYPNCTVYCKGDTGLVYAYLGIPKAIGIAISIGLVFIIRKIFGKISHQFYDYKSEEIFNQVDCSKQMILYPIVSSILLVTLLNFPMVVWVSTLPTILPQWLTFLSINNIKETL